VSRILGDLTWNKEFELMCPNNPIGTVDLFGSSHHGLGVSNSPVLVHGIRPRVAIVNNGTPQGALSPPSMKTLFSSPGIEDVWQIHFSSPSSAGRSIRCQECSSPTALTSR